MTTATHLSNTVSHRLLALLAASGPTDATNAALAQQLSCSAPAVKKALRALEDSDLVLIVRRRRNAYLGDPAGRTITLTVGA